LKAPRQKKKMSGADEKRPRGKVLHPGEKGGGGVPSRPKKPAFGEKRQKKRWGGPLLWEEGRLPLKKRRKGYARSTLLPKKKKLGTVGFSRDQRGGRRRPRGTRGNSPVTERKKKKSPIYNRTKTGEAQKKKTSTERRPRAREPTTSCEKRGKLVFLVGWFKEPRAGGFPPHKTRRSTRQKREEEALPSRKRGQIPEKGRK